MYADDTTLLSHDEDDVHNALQQVEKFALFSGLKLNRLKTEAMMIGKDPPEITSGFLASNRWIDEDPGHIFQ